MADILAKTPTVPDGRILKYQIKNKDTGDIVAHHTQVVSRVTEEGQECYKVEVRTEGGGIGVLEETAVLGIADTLKLVSWHLVAHDNRGNKWMESSGKYADLKELLESSLTSVKRCAMQSPCLGCVNITNCTPPGMVNFCLEGLPLTPKSKGNVLIMLVEGKYLEIDTATSSKERVTVPAGDSECYKLESFPDLSCVLNNIPVHVPGMAMMVKPLLATTHRWLSVEEPHYLVMFEGSICMAAAGERVIGELMSIETPNG